MSSLQDFLDIAGRRTAVRLYKAMHIAGRRKAVRLYKAMHIAGRRKAGLAGIFLEKK